MRSSRDGLIIFHEGTSTFDFTGDSTRYILPDVIWWAELPHETFVIDPETGNSFEITIDCGAEIDDSTLVTSHDILTHGYASYLSITPLHVC